MQDKPTPLPVIKIAVISTIIFCNTFMATVLLPFLSFMISDFNVAPNQDEIGRYSGYLVGSFMLGQLIFSYVWGTISDRLGRRPILLVGLIMTAFSFLSFGFSTSYTMAIVLRLINGSVNGIVGVCKTYLSEITDSTNQAKGFAFLGVMRGLGMIVGPIVGGFLCLPAEKYPQIFPKGSLFDMFPYALPCVVGWGIAMIGTLVGFFVLEETNQAAIASNKRAFFYTWFINRQEAAPLLQDQVDDSTTEIDAEPRLSIWQLVCMPRVYYSFILYTLTSFIYIQYDELFALWSRLPVSEGGLNFSSSDQGAAFAIGGFMLFFYQIFLFAPIEKALGCLKTFQTGLLLSLPAFIILPLISKYGMLHEGRVEYLMWTLVGVCNILRTVGGVQAFTSTFIMVSNSVTSNYRGQINGSAQSLGSIGRMLGPIFAGTLFTWSLESNMPYPFDYHFVFNLLAVIVLLGYLISLRMPKDIDNRLEED